MTHGNICYQKEDNSVVLVWVQCGHDLHTLQNYFKWLQNHTFSLQQSWDYRGVTNLPSPLFQHDLRKCLPWSWSFTIQSHPHSYSLKARNCRQNYHSLTSYSTFSSSSLHFHIFSLRSVAKTFMLIKLLNKKKWKKHFERFCNLKGHNITVLR